MAVLGHDTLAEADKDIEEADQGTLSDAVARPEAQTGSHF